jgi:hypothetical protein
MDIDTAKSCVGPGWHALLDAFYFILPSCVRVVGVKEKWGGLRIDLDSADVHSWGLVELIEARSLTICELCGRPGTPGGKGWIKTLCEECRNERNQP